MLSLLSSLFSVIAVIVACVVAVSVAAVAATTIAVVPQSAMTVNSATPRRSTLAVAVDDGKHKRQTHDCIRWVLHLLLVLF